MSQVAAPPARPAPRGARLALVSLPLAAALALPGCAGRDATVKTVSAGDVSLLKGSPLTEVYFAPFDVSGVKLEGDHGDGAVAEGNKKKWSSHVVAGAQRYFDGIRGAGTGVSVLSAKTGLDDYDEVVMSKGKVRFRAGEPPPEALVVKGKYTFSKNVAGASRFFLGMMSGKSWNRADVTISRGATVIYSATVDGKYLGGGYSWGYETLAVNEGLGHGIAEIVWKLQRGLPIETK